MINRILQAVLAECQAAQPNSTIIFKTDFKLDNVLTYTMPLLLIDLIDAPESGQAIGGMTIMEWLFALNSYNYMPNPEVSPDGGYSTDLLKPVDEIRRHFTIGNWMTDGMTEIEENYGFKFSLSGITGADQIDADGLISGYKINFNSISVDVETFDMKKSHSVVTVVEDDTRK